MRLLESGVSVTSDAPTPRHHVVHANERSKLTEVTPGNEASSLFNEFVMFIFRQTEVFLRGYWHVAIREFTAQRYDANVVLNSYNALQMVLVYLEIWMPARHRR